jgi:hypothetical protein
MTFFKHTEWAGAAMADPNWVAAIGQVAGALGTAAAAGIALATAMTAKKIAERGVRATERQTSLSVVQDLLEYYAGPEMYKALSRFGGFVAFDRGHVERFKCITEHFQKHGRKVDPDAIGTGDFAWALGGLEQDDDLGAARRLIHHHFKRVWALRQIRVIPDRELLLLTRDNSGYAMWRDEVLPLTAALGLSHVARGRPVSANEEWPNELIEWVETAARKKT